MYQQPPIITTNTPGVSALSHELANSARYEVSIHLVLKIGGTIQIGLSDVSMQNIYTLTHTIIRTCKMMCSECRVPNAEQRMPMKVWSCMCYNVHSYCCCWYLLLLLLLLILKVIVTVAFVLANNCAACCGHSSGKRAKLLKPAALSNTFVANFVTHTHTHSLMYISAYNCRCCNMLAHWCDDATTMPH